MNKELITDPLGIEDIRLDLGANIRLLKQLGINEVLVLFGFSWGRKIYEDTWTDIPLAPEQIEKRIAEAETKGFGRLGDDNLYITIASQDARLQYSYESDIHLSYSDENEFVETIRKRWLENDWLTETQRSKHYQR
jgi:hypothetical protein